MTQTTVPAVLRALRDQLTYALTGTHVSLGPSRLNEPGTLLCIGVADPDAPGYTTAVSHRQSWPLATHAGALAREESYRVNCTVDAVDGEGDLDAAMTAVWDVYETVAAHVRATPQNLGVLGVLWVSPSEEPGSFDMGLTQDGAIALLTFALTVTARI